MLMPQLAFWRTTYLLDLYPGAEAAWSLRKLSSSTTDVARLRRTTDNTEQDFTADEITDGTLATFAGANSVAVVTLYDQSGNGNDLTQSVAADQPFVVEGGTINLLNGRAASRYNGASLFLETSSQLITTNTWHMFCHFSKASGAVDGVTLLSQHVLGNSGRIMFLRDASGTISTFLNNGTSFSPTSSLSVSAAGVAQVGESRALSDDYDVAKDGGAFETVISGEALTPLNEPYRVGAYDGGNGSFWDGRIGDVIVYDSDQTSNRSAIVGDIENA